MNSIKILYHIGIEDQPITVDEEWKRAIPDDIRVEFIKSLDGIVSNLEGNGMCPTDKYTEPILATFFNNLGQYLCVYRCVRTKRCYDNHSIWVFIPHEVEISDLELLKLIKQLLSIIRREPDEIRLYINDLYALAGNITCTPRKGAISRLCSDTNGPIGWKYYGNGAESLELLLQYRFQADYQLYKYILLIDKESGLAGSSTIRQITNPIKKMVIFDPAVVLEKLPQGSTLLEANGNPANAHWVNAEVPLQLIVKRDGYEDQKLTLTYPFTNVQVGNNKFVVKRKMFNVKDKESGETINLWSLKINNVSVDGPSFAFYEDLLKKATVEIAAHSYETKVYNNYDILTDLQTVPVTVSLQRKQTSKELTPATADDCNGLKPENVKISVKLPERPDKQYPCPLYGYEFAVDDFGNTSDNQITFNKRAFVKLRTVIILLTVLFLIGLGGGIAIGHYALPSNTEQNQTSTNNSTEPTNVTSNDTDTSVQPSSPNSDIQKIEEALAHSEWEKAEFDKDNTLRQIFEAVNNLDANKIEELNNGDLKNCKSSNWLKIISIKDKMPTALKNWKDAKKWRGAYSLGNKQSINIDNYVQIIEKWAKASVEKSSTAKPKENNQSQTQNKSSNRLQGEKE